MNFELSNSNITSIGNISEIDHKIIEGVWRTEAGRGIYSVENYSIEWLGIRAENTILFPQIKKTTDTIKVNYTIYNPHHNEFIIYHTYASWFAGDKFGTKITDEGFHDVGGLGLHMYENRDLSNITTYNFTTFYNSKTGLYQFYYEGELIFESTHVAFQSLPYVPGTMYFSGVKSWGADLEILELDALILRDVSESPMGLSDFYRTLMVIYLFQVPEEILPHELCFLFIQLPMVLIAMIVVRDIFGSGG
ncbi:MAG: hypothetical protein SVY15_04070 [Halobacteriota archaeon]|nr:hypothetical protein [Halobacteriota archaeon]